MATEDLIPTYLREIYNRAIPDQLSDNEPLQQFSAPLDELSLSDLVSAVSAGRPSLYGVAKYGVANYQGRADLTLSSPGTLITDQTRAAALAWGTGQQGGQTDGLQNDGSFFIGRAATNLFRRGQCDALGAGGAADSIWNNGGGGVVGRFVDATTPAPFSPQSIKYVADGTAATQSCLPQSASGLAIAAGTTVVGSMYFKGVAGQSYQHRLRIVNTDATTTFGSVTTFVATGDWQLLIHTPAVVAAGKTGDIIRGECLINGTRAETFWAAHAMLEKGQSVVAPYVATSGGATATKPGGSVGAPSSLIAETGFGIVMRVAMGYDATVTDIFRTFFDWRATGHNSDLTIQWRPNSPRWKFQLTDSGNVAHQANITAPGFVSAGDQVTIGAQAHDDGTNTTIGITVNGSTWTNLVIPGTLASLFGTDVFDSDFWIGSSSGLNGQCDSRIKWAATFTGTLTDADAAIVNAFGNTVPKFSQLSAANQCTGIIVPTASNPIVLLGP